MSLINLLRQPQVNSISSCACACRHYKQLKLHSNCSLCMGIEHARGGRDDLLPVRAINKHAPTLFQWFDCLWETTDQLAMELRPTHSHHTSLHKNVDLCVVTAGGRCPHNSQKKRRCRHAEILSLTKRKRHGQRQEDLSNM